MADLSSTLDRLARAGEAAAHPVPAVEVRRRGARRRHRRIAAATGAGVLSLGAALAVGADALNPLAAPPPVAPAGPAAPDSPTPPGLLRAGDLPATAETPWRRDDTAAALVLAGQCLPPAPETGGQYVQRTFTGDPAVDNGQAVHQVALRTADPAAAESAYDRYLQALTSCADSTDGVRLWEQVGVLAGSADEAEGLTLSVDVGRPDDALVAQVGLARAGTTVTVLVWQGYSQEVPAAGSVSALLGTAVDRLGPAAD